MPISPYDFHSAVIRHIDSELKNGKTMIYVSRYAEVAFIKHIYEPLGWQIQVPTAIVHAAGSPQNQIVLEFIPAKL